MAEFRAGMLGCGGIANAHAQVIANLASTELVACCDLARERAESFSQRYADGKAEVYTDFGRMFDRAKMDVVFICLPPFAHSNEVELAAERGIHVFIEKPIALTMSAANQMVRAVKKAGVKSQVGFMARHSGLVELVKRELESGDAGPVSLFTGRYLCNALHAPWWRDKSKSGGQLVEQVIHLYDLCRYLLGRPVSVYGQQRNLLHGAVEGYTVEDVSATVIAFESGALASIVGTNTAIPSKWLSMWDLVTQYRTVFASDLNRGVIRRTDSASPMELTVASEKDVFRAQALDLLNAIETDGETRCPMWEGAETLKLVLAANRSARRGSPIELR
ncbi:MAG: Gfo/Idh/MocA family oxidoreductase [Armatimonadetes bacterium]|nr:Gfo/Idh/MocA family oxidoreductase [Armatimonadota bacterium]